jgi:hypothetical protein
VSLITEFLGLDKPKADKVRPSAHEIALADVAGKRAENYEQRFLPLEIYEIENYRDPAVHENRRNLLGARQNADVAMSEFQAMSNAGRSAGATGKGLASGGYTDALGNIAINTDLSQREAGISAAQQALTLRDQEGLGIVRTGQNVNRDSLTGLGMVAQQGHASSMARLQTRIDSDATRSKALSGLASKGEMVAGAFI